MPSALYLDIHRDDPVTDANVSFHGRQLKLLLQDTTTGRWSREGTYVQGEVELPNHRADKISELYSLEQIVHIQLDSDGTTLLGTIEYQVSNDNGSIWMYWDGGAWSTAGVTDFATFNDTSENLPTFPIRRLGLAAGNPDNDIRQIKFNIRLTPATDSVTGVQFTPCLLQLKINYELDYKFHEDIKRSFKRLIDAGVRAKAREIHTLETATDTFMIEPFFGVGNDDVTSVYNLTTDPSRTTNILDFNVGEIVTMTSAQSIGDDIEVNFVGNVPVFLSADLHLEESVLPAWVVLIDVSEERKELRSEANIVEYRQTDTSFTSRVRGPQLYHDIAITMSSLANSEVASLAMTDAAREAFQWIQDFRLLDSGELLTILEYTPLAEADDIREGLYVKTASLDGLVAAPQSAFKETPLTTEINIGIGLLDSVESNLSITE